MMILAQTLGLSLTDIGVQVVSTGATALVAAVITGRVMIGRLDERMRAQEGRIAELGRSLETEGKAIEEARLEQARCELRTAQNYATSGEFCRLVVDNAHNFDGLKRSIDAMTEAVHSRVTDLAESLSELKGRLEGKPS